ncbi:hypothetical protein M378DRAFT_346576 [Amanita muscaria Koide BX008]|uniref:Uncharacterized protein n=1 Tax=Amanita muscaria (strain Koide BX008) TaxID=946122 RepID=A0A0C2WP65_AMAMK|nr:hypothetical protein M378DRAFT_346576 [Amanita muscaria Koide BX008]
MLYSSPWFSHMYFFVSCTRPSRCSESTKTSVFFFNPDYWNKRIQQVGHHNGLPKRFIAGQLMVLFPYVISILSAFPFLKRLRKAHRATRGKSGRCVTSQPILTLILMAFCSGPIFAIQTLASTWQVA